MNHEEVETIRAHLRERVRQAAEWANEGFPGAAFDNFREIIGGELCTIDPEQSVNFAPRKQGTGIRFRVNIGEPPDRVAYIDVLLGPEIKTDERRGLGPWIKVKAVNLTDDPKVSPKKDVIAPYVKVEDCDPSVPIDEFFKTWLRKALQSENKEKVLVHAYQLR